MDGKLTRKAGVLSILEPEASMCKTVKIESSPESVNSDPYGDGWIIKIRITDMSELEGLLSVEDYKAEIGV